MILGFTTTIGWDWHSFHSCWDDSPVIGKCILLILYTYHMWQLDLALHILYLPIHAMRVSQMLMLQNQMVYSNGPIWPVICSVMQQILWLKELLPISALNFFRDKFPQGDDHYPVSFILNSMASLLASAMNPLLSTHCMPHSMTFHLTKHEAESSLLSSMIYIMISLLKGGGWLSQY